MKSKSRNTSKEQIIIKAATKVLGQYGYERATISLIAAEAGVSRGLLYYYFTEVSHTFLRRTDITID